MADVTPVVLPAALLVPLQVGELGGIDVALVADVMAVGALYVLPHGTVSFEVTTVAIASCGVHRGY